MNRVRCFGPGINHHIVRPNIRLGRQILVPFVIVFHHRKDPLRTLNITMLRKDINDRTVNDRIRTNRSMRRRRCRRSVRRIFFGVRSSRGRRRLVVIIQHRL